MVAEKANKENKFSVDVNSRSHERNGQKGQAR